MPEDVNPLLAYFEQNRGRVVHKLLHYFDIYDRHFRPFRDRPITLVEFGVFHGGSLHMWRDYFGPAARIVGVDIDPRCASLTDDKAEVIIGDQEDRAFLNGLAERLGPVDIVIDDGGHTMGQQIATFEGLWPAVRDGGVFLSEDLCTSYWADYGGGYRRESTFIEYAKGLVDQLHAWHSQDDARLEVDDYTRSLSGMHVYDSVIVFDKGVVSRPRQRLTGVPTFEDAGVATLLEAQREFDRTGTAPPGEGITF